MREHKSLRWLFSWLEHHDYLWHINRKRNKS